MPAAPSPPRIPLSAAGRSAGPLTCTVLTRADEADRLRPAWAALQERSERQELTQSPDWLLTWWDVYGRLQGRELRLGAFYDAGQLVGLAPLLRRRHWHHRCLPLRRLEFLGSGERVRQGVYSNHLNLLAERGREADVARRLVQALGEGAFGAWDEIVLPMMSGDGPVPDLLVGAFAGAGLSAEKSVMAEAPFIRLPATWPDYLKSLSRNERRRITRALRAFDAWAGSAYQLEAVKEPADLAKGQRILIDLHHRRWKRDDRPGVFRSPPYLQFHAAVMPCLLERGALELFWLSARGEPVAALYAISWGGKVYAYQMGRRTDLPPRLSLGRVLVAHAIRRAIAAGRKEFDLLADDTPFKTQFTRAKRALVQVRVVRPCLVENLRATASASARFLRRVVRACGWFPTG